jgi:hypothetical protein
MHRWGCADFLGRLGYMRIPCLVQDSMVEALFRPCFRSFNMKCRSFISAFSRLVGDENDGEDDDPNPPQSNHDVSHAFCAQSSAGLRSPNFVGFRHPYIKYRGRPCCGWSGSDYETCPNSHPSFFDACVRARVWLSGRQG